MAARSRPAPAFSWVRAAASLAFVVIPPVLAASALAAWNEYAEIETTISERFDGQRWELASQVYSDAYDVYPGLAVDSPAFRARLARLGYRETDAVPTRRGQYRFSKAQRTLDIYLNRFDYPDGAESGRLLRAHLDAGGRILRLVEVADGHEIWDFRLEPMVLAGFHSEEAQARRVMRLDETPAVLVRAIVATEDRRFFEHAGVDARSLARAMLVNVTAGEVRQGGSTLTQQLMKNFFLTSDRTLGRKLREAAMALIAERRMSKLEILESYLNEIYFGQAGATGIHGVWEAARHYFGREPAELTVAQAATLAGMIRAPNYYSPHRHPERARERRDVVLALMHEQGDLDDALLEAALKEPMDVVPPPRTEMAAPYFVDFLHRELLDRYPREVLHGDGLRIFTTLDPQMQAAAEKAVAENVAAMEKDIGPAIAKAGGQQLQAALIALDPRTGALRAMVGGRDYKQTQFNRAMDSRRQPGSTFKPIVMLAALGSEHVGGAHYLPTSRVMDERLEWRYEGQVWSPSNYEGKFYGEVSVREALEHSLNSATARIAQSIGIRPIRDLAVRLGMDPKLQAFPAIVLGGWEVPPFDIAKVFGVFAAGGMAATPISVRKVLASDGRVEEGHRVEIRRVVPAADAYLVTHMLAGVMERGTGASARRKGFRHPAAGKTGTSNDYKDAWFVGYTPDLLAVVWVGFDRAASMGLAGSQAALPIWTDFMREALADRPHTSFDVPAGVVLVDVDKDTAGLATADCPRVVREAFLAGEEPSEPCAEHSGI
jgi:penicillin-binding protein 1B